MFGYNEPIRQINEENENDKENAKLKQILNANRIHTYEFVRIQARE